MLWCFIHERIAWANLNFLCDVKLLLMSWSPAKGLSISRWIPYFKILTNSFSKSYGFKFYSNKASSILTFSACNYMLKVNRNTNFVNFEQANVAWLWVLDSNIHNFFKNLILKAQLASRTEPGLDWTNLRKILQKEYLGKRGNEGVRGYCFEYFS